MPKATDTPKVDVISIPSIEEIERFVIDAGSDSVQVFGGNFEGGSQIQQVPDEISRCLFDILSSRKKIGAYLEIGAAAGGTTFLMNHFLKPEKIVLIDDNMHPKHHIRPYILRDVKYSEVVGNSHSEGALSAIKNMSVMFDLILIDGDHSYAGCKNDAENFARFLNDGGFLMFHDSYCTECWGVHQVVEEFKNNKDFLFVGEYITETHPRKCGIALFAKRINENK